MSRADNLNDYREIQAKQLESNRVGKVVVTREGSYETPEEAFDVYKTAKEKYIKDLADSYKAKIPEKLYRAMYNYKIEITD